MEDAHAKTTEEVLNYFQTDPEKGLTPDQIKRYQAKYGPNGKWDYILLKQKKKLFKNAMWWLTTIYTPKLAHKTYMAYSCYSHYLL